MAWACKDLNENRGVYLYDTTDEGTYAFLGGMTVKPTASAKAPMLTSLDEVPYRDIPVPQRSPTFETAMKVVDRQWTVVIVPLDGNERTHPVFVVIGGAVIFLFFAILAWMLIRHLSRKHMINSFKSKVEMDKAKVYHIQVQRERRLNEYLA